FARPVPGRRRTRPAGSSMEQRLPQGRQRPGRGGRHAVTVQLLNASIGDLAALAEQGATKEDIANCFHCPIAFLTTQTNLANLYASERLHMTKAIGPRLQRRDEKLNEQLVPLFDPSRRLFLASEDPLPVDPSHTLQQMEAD